MRACVRVCVCILLRHTSFCWGCHFQIIYITYTGVASVFAKFSSFDASVLVIKVIDEENLSSQANRKTQLEGAVFPVSAASNQP